MMYLLDTDHVSLLNRGGPPGQRIRARLTDLTAADFATSVISYEEQLRGWLAYLAPLRTVDAQTRAYDELLSMLRLYCATPVLPFDGPAAQEYTRVRRLCPRLGAMDLKVAAVALTHNATVLTRNLKDFRQVPDLRAEDWTR